MHNSRPPRGRMGVGLPPQNRFQRAVQGHPVNNYHHQHSQQHPHHRLMNNMAWQQTVPNMSNMNNYHMNQGDNSLMPYQQQHLESYGNYMPAMQSLNMPSSEMMNPNNQHLYQGYIPQNFVLQPQLMHGSISPVESVMISQPINIGTPTPPPLQPPMANSTSPLQTPMINSPTNSMVNQLPVVKKPYDKFNSRDNLVRCAKCNHENHLAACELSNKDEEISRLQAQVTQLTNELKYITNQLRQDQSIHSQPPIRILQPDHSHSLVPKLSHLSPEAPEFKPDENNASVAYASPVANEVPVVSAKVMNEEPVTDVQLDLDELVIEEDNGKLEHENVVEVIAPNETPPEESVVFNEPHECQSSEEISEQPQDFRTVEDQICVSSNESDLAAAGSTPVVTEVPQEQNMCQEQVEDNEPEEELVALTDSSSQIPESTDDDNNSSSEIQMPISTNEPEHIAEDNTQRAVFTSHYDNQRGNNRWDNKKNDQGYSRGYNRIAGRGTSRGRNDGFISDKSQQNTLPYRNQNQQSQSYSNRQQNFRRNKFGDDSQDKKPYRDSSGDSYTDSGPKERNGQTDYRGKSWEPRGNPHKMANNNNNHQPPINWSDDHKQYQDRSKEESGRDLLTELKTKNNSGATRGNERRHHHNKQYHITELKADVFTAPNDFALAHCVAQDFRMGSGIAVKFKSEFKRVPELLDQNIGVGGCAHLVHNERYIFYLVTKEVSKGKPTMATMQQSLEALKEKCLRYGVNKLAMPHIGCGLDKLNWPQVRALITEIFSDTGIVINVYDFNAEGLSESEGNRATTSLKVVYKIMSLISIEPFTALIFFGTEDGHMDSTATSMNEKLNFVNEYRNAPKSVGKIWFRNQRSCDKYFVYSLIVAKSYKDRVLFTTVEQCCRELQKQLRRTETEFVGLEDLSDWERQDNTFTEKVATMLRNLLHRPVKELWICYRNEDRDVYKMTKSSHE